MATVCCSWGRCHHPDHMVFLCASQKTLCICARQSFLTIDNRMEPDMLAQLIVPWHTMVVISSPLNLGTIVIVLWDGCRNWCNTSMRMMDSMIKATQGSIEAACKQAATQGQDDGHLDDLRRGMPRGVKRKAHKLNRYASEAHLVSDLAVTHR